jgi:hypothetical protein
MSKLATIPIVESLVICCSAPLGYLPAAAPTDKEAEKVAEPNSPVVEARVAVEIGHESSMQLALTNARRIRT